MSEQVKRIPIKYTNSDIEIKLINGGNIKMEEDYVFEGSVAQTIANTPIDIQKAINEINKNIDYLKNE
jgi:hypothetical protein